MKGVREHAPQNAHEVNTTEIFPRVLLAAWIEPLSGAHTDQARLTDKRFGHLHKQHLSQDL
jgi:hypothetical protein